MDKRTLAILTLIVLGAFARAIPHPPNVAPIAAIALFGGAMLRDRRAAYGAPLVTMLLSDLFLAAFVYGARPLIHSQPIVYACFLATVAIGVLVKRRRTPLVIGAASLASSILFYLVTNFAVWAGGSMYPKTAPGLVTCYQAAIPFFRNTLGGDLAFASLLFGGFALWQHFVPALRENRQLAIS
jgi:hypothetical protein